MITRSNLADQLREYQIRSKNDWASLSFFSSTSNISSRMEVMSVIWELLTFALIVFSAVSLYFRMEVMPVIWELLTFALIVFSAVSLYFSSEKGDGRVEDIHAMHLDEAVHEIPEGSTDTDQMNRGEETAGIENYGTWMMKGYSGHRGRGRGPALPSRSTTMGVSQRGQPSNVYSGRAPAGDRATRGGRGGFVAGRGTQSRGKPLSYIEGPSTDETWPPLAKPNQQKGKELANPIKDLIPYPPPSPRGESSLSLVPRPPTIGSPRKDVTPIPSLLVPMADNKDGGE
ncbi:hypothetical protein J5N97_001868 [Dioscorea zingiberensis]|uniref:Uncharacterized protein n=1 Tax=Dioscorea zingiberensis TaxID=325984 RepID=A0A9D5BT75_9LILI|nr:hypothetical protein J5N97_001868 [Dioscorea zingiberensis]